MGNEIVQNFLNDTTVDVNTRREYQSALNSGKGTVDMATKAIIGKYGNKYGTPKVESFSATTTYPAAPQQGAAIQAPTPFVSKLLNLKNPYEALATVAPSIAAETAKMGAKIQPDPISKMVVNVPKLKPADVLGVLGQNFMEIPEGLMQMGEGAAGTAQAISDFSQGKPVSPDAANDLSGGFSKFIGGTLKTAGAPVIGAALTAPVFAETVMPIGGKETADVIRSGESALATAGNLPNVAIGNIAKLAAKTANPDLDEAYLEEHIAKPAQQAFQIYRLVHNTNANWKKQSDQEKARLAQEEQAKLNAEQAGKMTTTKADLLRAGVPEAEANMLDKLTPEQRQYFIEANKQAKAFINDPINQPNPFKWEAKKLDDALDDLEKTRKVLGEKVGDAKLYFDNKSYVSRDDLHKAIIDALDDAKVNAVRTNPDGTRYIDLSRSDLKTDAEAIKTIKDAIKMTADDVNNPNADILDVANAYMGGNQIPSRDVLSVVKALNKALGTYDKNGKLFTGSSDIAMQQIVNNLNDKLLFPQSDAYKQAAINYAKFMKDFKVVDGAMTGMQAGGAEYSRGESFLRSAVNNTRPTSEQVIPAWENLKNNFGVNIPEGLTWKPWILKTVQNLEGAYKPGSLEGILSNFAGAKGKAGMVQAVADFVHPTEKIRNGLNKIESIVTNLPSSDASAASQALFDLKSGLGSLLKSIDPTVSGALQEADERPIKNPLQGLIPQAHAADVDTQVEQLNQVAQKAPELNNQIKGVIDWIKNIVPRSNPIFDDRKALQEMNPNTNYFELDKKGDFVIPLDTIKSELRSMQENAVRSGDINSNNIG